MATNTTLTSHLAARNNLRQRHYAPLSERGQRIVEQGRAQRVELTPEAEKGVEWGREKGKGNE